jgi:hypothetical protein
MKKSLKIILFIIFFFFLFFLLFSFASSQSSLVDQINKQNEAFAGQSGAGFGETANLKRIVINIIDILLSVVATISVAMFVYAGFLYFTSQGEEGKMETAKKTIFYAVIGSLIIFMAYSLSWFISYVFLKSNPAETGEGVFDFKSNVWVEEREDWSHPMDESSVIDFYN